VIHGRRPKSHRNDDGGFLQRTFPEAPIHQPNRMPNYQLQFPGKMTDFVKCCTRSFVGLTAAVAFSMSGSLRAGEMAESNPVVYEKGSLIDPISGAVSVGYDSTYMFRGANLGKHAPWGEIDLTAPIGAFAINAGAWYTNPTKPDGGILSDDNDELDLYLSASTTLGVVDVWLGYTAYLYPESARGGTNELGMGGSASINFFDFGVSYYRDLNLDANYFEYFLGKNIDLNEFAAVNFNILVGHHGSRNFHGVLMSSLDLALTDAASLSAYIAYNFVDKERAGTGFEDRLYGGASVRVSF
jgi:hypothetical protein